MDTRTKSMRCGRARELWVADDAPGGNYVARVRALLATQAFVPGLHHIDIAHEDCCSFYRGEPCDCDPTVTLRGEA